MKHLVCILWAVCLFAGPITSASAIDYYVNNVGGNDGFDGRNETPGTGRGGPWRTIERAMRVVGAGDRVILAKSSEPYRESIHLGRRQSGEPNAPLTIVGHGAKLDGTRAVPSRAWEPYQGDVVRFRPAGLGSQALLRDGRALRQYPVNRLAGNVPPLKPLEWCLMDGYIYLRLEKNKTTLDYALSHSFLETGITLYGADHVIIEDLFVQGFRYDGIAAADRARGVRLRSLTLRGNGRSGLSVTGASEVMLDNSLVEDNGQAQVRVEAPGQLIVDRSELADSWAPRFEVRGSPKLLMDGVPAAHRP